MKVLKFFATWCGPCQALTMTLNDMEIKIPVEEVNVENTPELATKYGVRSIPTMVLVDEDGNTIRTVQGALKKEKIQEFLGEYA